MSVLYFWHESYGADLVAMGMDRLERLVEQSHQVLTSAAREIEEPKSSGG